VKIKKIGFLALAVVLVFATLGIGYSAWTDQVVINGSVHTGTVDLQVVEYSGMWFWKVPGGVPEYYFTTDPNYVPTPVPDNPAPFIVAYAASSQTTGPSGPVDDAVDMTFDNLFPLDGGVPIHGPGGGLLGSQIAWRANFVIHYNGTVPAMVSADFTNVTGDAALLGLWQPFPAQTYTGIWVCFQRLVGYPGSGDPWPYATGPLITNAVQMHYCEYVLCWMCVEIPQDNAYQGLSGSFTAEINAIQWNEAP